jgi:endogenous inhibitor of DNA gyrase (YacG/DUF329 family)
MVRMREPPEGPVCVFCRLRPIDPAHRPFCSERCRTLDLARWADGAYRIPDREPHDEDETKSDGS